ncbi:MAG TPA: acyl-CoA dehydrogenase family protein [Longimicrobiaceae bacterium]|nr:acyl-CoA dehydrogenase family protein [Longimicrobiaceae bacterium]
MPNALNLSGIALTTNQGHWKRKAKKFAQEVLAPTAAQTDASGEFPKENLRKLGQAGFLSLVVPKEMGGAGEGILTAAMVLEELAQGCTSSTMAVAMHFSALPLMVALVEGDEQREKIIAPVVRGEAFGSFAMSEPGSGNRLWHTDSHAGTDGDDFIVDCFKSFATSAGQADYYVVPTKPRADAGPNDLSLFVLDGADPNIKPVGKWDGMGLRGNSSTPIKFDKVRAEPWRRLGGENAGFSMLFAYSLPIYQVALASVYVGLAQQAFDVAVGHVKQRIHTDTGQALASVETVQRYIAEMKMGIDLVRNTVYRVAQMSDNATVLFDELNTAGLLDEIIRENPDDPFFVELAEIKTAACENVISVAHKALQVCGGTAYKRGHPAERIYRDARAGSVMAPSDDTLKLIVGRQILGIDQPWA